MPGPFQVRKAGTLDATARTGDGPGSENPVPIEGMNSVTLLVDATIPSSASFRVEVEITADGDNYYRTTTQAAGVTGSVAVSKAAYVALDTHVSATFCLTVPVHGRAARFTTSVTSGSQTNTGGVRALTAFV